MRPNMLAVDAAADKPRDRRVVFGVVATGVQRNCRSLPRALAWPYLHTDAIDLLVHRWVEIPTAGGGR